MLLLSRLLITKVLPKTVPMLSRYIVAQGLAASIHHQSTWLLAKTLFYSITIGIKFLSTSFLKDILPADVKLDLTTVKRVLISALWARLSRYFILGWVLVPLRTIVGELLINGVMGNTDFARFLVNKLNLITIPWLDSVNNITSYLYNNIQPYSQISSYWIPVMAGIFALGSYIYMNQDSPFVTDLRLVWNVIKTNWGRFQNTWFFTNLIVPITVKPFNWIKNNRKNIIWFLCVPLGLARFLFNCSWTIVGNLVEGTVEVIKFIFRRR